MKWDENKKQKIRQQLIKKVTPFMKEIKILREGTNVFREKQEDLYVCTVKGYYHKGGTYINNVAKDGTSLNKNYEDRVLLIVDDEVKKIKEHDFFKFDDITYEIIDKGNIEDIVWDTFLKRKE